MPTDPSLTDEEERYILRPHRGKEQDAIDQNILLKRGEIFIEYLNEGIGKGIGRIKIGDGVTTYRTLPYFVDQTDLSDSFLKKFVATTVTNDNTLLGMIANNKNLATITAAEKKLFENRIAHEADFGTSISSLVTQIGKNTSSISTLWSTVIASTTLNNQSLRNDITDLQEGGGAAGTAIAVLQSTVFDNTGTNNKGNGSNNGTTQSATANTSLRSDINTLWEATFNNASTGIGNQRLKTNVNTLENAVVNSTGTNDPKYNTWLNGTTQSATANESLRKDINTLWDNVFNNEPGTGHDVYTQLGNRALRLDVNNLKNDVNALTTETIPNLASSVSNNSNSINTLWSTVIASTSLNNQSLRDDITDLQEGGGGAGTAIAALQTSVANLNSSMSNVEGNVSNIGSSVGTLWSTVVDSQGNNNTGNGQNNGSTQNSRGNVSLRTDLNTLWSTVYNNDNGGIGNSRLKMYINTHGEYIGGLQSATSSLNSSVNGLQSATASINSSVSTINTNLTNLSNYFTSNIANITNGYTASLPSGISNVDNIDKTSIYNVDGGSISGLPDGNWYFVATFIHIGGSGWRTQIAIPMTDGQIFIRRFVNGTSWTSWSSFLSGSVSGNTLNII